jgi:hypothetical protein
MMGMTVHQKGISIPRDTYEQVKKRADSTGTSVSAWLDGAARGRLAREAAAAYAEVADLGPFAEKIAAFHEVASGARGMQDAPSVHGRLRRGRRYGQIWEVAGVQVLVVSSDDYNDHPSNPPLVVLVVPDPAFASAEPFMIATNDRDPVSGSILVPVMRPCAALTLDAECVGVMSPSTMLAVIDGMRAMLEL